MLTPLFNGSGKMRVAGLMSGSGTNLRKIIEHQGEGGYSVVVIFTDNPKSNAEKIGAEHGIPVITLDLAAFYAGKGLKKSDLSIRPEYDKQIVDALKPFKPDVLAFCGYMCIASSVLTSAVLGVNVHPADLSIQENGRRKFTGGHAVLDAIKVGEKTIASSTHVVEQVVDGGRLLMISKPLPIILPENFDAGNVEVLNKAVEENQTRLKVEGDWVIFPKTLEYIANKRFAQDEKGAIHFDRKAMPNGLRI